MRDRRLLQKIFGIRLLSDSLSYDFYQALQPIWYATGFQRGTCLILATFTESIRRSGWGDQSDLSAIRTQVERIAVGPNLVPMIAEEEMRVNEGFWRFR